MLIATLDVAERHSCGDVLEDRLQPCLAAGQRALRFPGAGDVLDLCDEMRRRARRVTNEPDRQLDPDHVPVAVQVALVHLIAVALAAHQRRDMRKIGVQIVGVRDVLKGAGGAARLSLQPTISHSAWLTFSHDPSRPTRAIPIGASANAVSNSTWAARRACSAACAPSDRV